jgi:uncharacterized protein
VLERFNVKKIPVQHCFQTNATLLTQDWCDYFKAHKADVSVSIDGPLRFHDANRVTRSGRGTFERAMRGVRLLQANGIEIYNIAVLTDASLDHPDEVWDFFIGAGITHLAFNVEEQEGCHTQSSVRHAGDTARFQAFLRRLRQRRKASGRDVLIRELDGMAERVRFANGEPESMVNLPLATLSFDCEGDISTFSPELLSMRHPKYRDFKFGNVFECGVDDILEREHFRAVHEDIRRGAEKCRATCPYFSVCGGGEPTNKLAENGTFDSTETMHCRLVVQALCDVALEEAEESLGLESPPAPPRPTPAGRFIPLAMVASA